MTDLSDIPVIAITRDGQQTTTTMAKAIESLTPPQVIKRTPTRRCDECGQFSRHEDLTPVNTEDGGVTRVCDDCMDKKSDDNPRKTYKQVKQEQWSEAVEKMDSIIANSRISFPPQDALTKAQGEARLSLAYERSMAYLRRMAVPSGGNDRVTRLVKAEITRRKTDEIVAKTKRTKKRIAKLRRKSDAMEIAKGEAEQMLAQLLETQAAATAQLDEMARRVDVVYANAQKSYGAITRQRDIQRTAELAREDQRRAMWTEKMINATDPLLRQVYEARAKGREYDDDQD